MAGVPMTSKGSSGGGTLGQKAFSAASTAAKGISIANGVREAVPIVQGVVRAGMAAAQHAWPVLL